MNRDSLGISLLRNAVATPLSFIAPVAFGKGDAYAERFGKVVNRQRVNGGNRGLASFDWLDSLSNHAGNSTYRRIKLDLLVTSKSFSEPAYCPSVWPTVRYNPGESRKRFVFLPFCQLVIPFFGVLGDN